MSETSTTPGNDPQKDDTTAGSTTVEDSTKGTDNQPADNGDNLDASKSTDDTSAGDDKSTDDKSGADDTAADDKSGADDTPASFDDDLDAWIEKRGLPAPADEAQKQKYQDLRNEQREFTREQQAKKDADALGDELSKTKADLKGDEDDEDEDDELAKDVKALKEDRDNERNLRLQSEFYVSNKVSDAEHKAILEVIKEKVARPTSKEDKLKALDFWGNPNQLPDLLDIARARVSKTDVDAVADEAARQERERIAKESNATGPGRNATRSSTSDSTPEEERHQSLLERYSKPRS